jgi:hypothetical protein
MKRFLFCLVALIGVMVLVAPAYAVEMQINGIKRVKAISYDNMDGDKDSDDQNNFFHSRLRMYFTSVASENLKMVYKNEIDFNWGDSSGSTVTDSEGHTHASSSRRGKGGGLGGDQVNLETKNVYLEFMVPDTPVKATLGLQGITLHKGWWISDDASAARFDMNFDPVAITLAYVNAQDSDFTDSSDDVWQLHASAGYKAENMDARFSVGYEKGSNDRENPAFNSDDAVDADNNPERLDSSIESDDFYQVMGEFSMSFDMVSFFVIAAKNFGEVKGEGGADDVDYNGYMAHVGVDFALDLATIGVQFIYTSGDEEDSDGEDNYRSFSGETFSWAEIPSDGYLWEANSDMSQIGGDNTPSNMWALNVGADLKPTDTTSIALDIWYINMVEKRTVGDDEEDEVGTEVDLKLTQKVYDNLDCLIIGSYMFAEDGYGAGGGDDGWILALGLNYKF